MINHGISTGALFAIVGMIYERFHTRQISELNGLARRFPIMAFFMLLFTFSSIGLPGLNGFAGEILILLGMFHRGWAAAPSDYGFQYRIISVLALSGVVLGIGTCYGWSAIRFSDPGMQSVARLRATMRIRTAPIPN